MARTLTIEHLSQARACPRETAIFKRLFGDGNECTLDRCMEAAPHFDWVFAAHHLLTPKQQAAFKANVMAGFRQVRRMADRDKQKKRRAMAHAFFKAFNSPEA